MKYRNLVVREYGGPEVLEVVEHELRPPAKGEARIRVLASSVSRPDVSARRGEALSLLKSGGRMVSFGEPASRPELYRILGLALRTRLAGRGRSLSLYGTSTYFLFEQKSYREDWETLFRLLVDGKIDPVIAARFPILEAARANALIESGRVTGNVVLVSPEVQEATK